MRFLHCNYHGASGVMLMSVLIHKPQLCCLTASEQQGERKRRNRAHAARRLAAQSAQCNKLSFMQMRAKHVHSMHVPRPLLSGPRVTAPAARQGKTRFLQKKECCAGALEGRFIATLCRLAHAKTVLEVGMFTGTTTLAVALALPADGRVRPRPRLPPHILG